MDDPLPDREQLLREILAGDLDRRDPRVRGQMERDPGFEERLAELERMSRWLEEGGAEQRAVLHEASVPRGTEGEALVQELLERPRRRSRWPLALAAAAAVVLGFLWARGGEPELEPRPLELAVLGDGEPGALFPLGEVAAYSRFEWDFDLPDGGWFQVIVSSAEDDRELQRSRPGVQSSWEPEADVRGAWPERIRWTVNAYDATGVVIWSDGEEAWRSP